MFSDSLGLVELRKAVILTVTTSWSEKIQIKISQGKRRTEQRPGETRYKLPVQSYKQCLILLVMLCDNTHTKYHTPGRLPEPSYPGLLLEVVRTGMADCPRG